MNLKFLIKEAMRNLRANFGRSLLTMLGILIGVSAVITMASLGLGVRNMINKEFDSVGKEEIYFTEGNFSVPSLRNPRLITIADMEAMEAEPYVRFCAPGVYGYENMTNDSDISANVYLNGDNEKYYQMNTAKKLVAGRPYSKNEIDNAALVVILFETAAKKFFPDMTPEQVLGQSVRIKQLAFEVIGIGRESDMTSGMDVLQVSIPYTTYLNRIATAEKNRIGNVMVIIDSSKITHKEATERLKKLLRVRHQIGAGEYDDFSVAAAEEVMEKVNNVLNVFIIFLSGVAAISLLVGGIGIMNIMLVTVTERTKEIGLRKALGAKNSDIRLQFLFESSFLSLIGGIIGIVLGLIFSQLGAMGIRMINPSTATFQSEISIPVIVGATLFSMAFGLFFGSYPASRAAQLQPVIALRSD